MHAGLTFSKWISAKAGNNVALLICIALNGYNGRVKYSWFKEGTLIEVETFLILYNSESGLYMCHIYSSEHSIDSWSTFKVEPG